MEMLDKEKLVNVYREVFPTPNYLVDYLKYNSDDDGEFLTIAPDYNCFIDFYEKWGNDIDDDDLNEFDSMMLLLMKADLEQLNYDVKIEDNYLTAIIR